MTTNQQIWKKLLSANRLKDAIKGKTTNEDNLDIRNSFERDCDRITYSYPFRRLQDKTQVIPLPIIDFVHTRLTHTLEVATVGRSLGKIVENFLIKQNDILENQRGQIPTIIYAACLAHDIGNPPFGHSGEDSISDYFRGKQGLKSIKENFQDTEMKNVKICDLQNFEGNAMGFRLLTKYEDVGMNLTCAVLATFTKYPRQSFITGESEDTRWNDQRTSQKKYGFFYTELEEFKVVANETGMIQLKNGPEDFTWCRHPLSFLLEAADDICYRIIDLEDGFRIGKIPFIEAENHLLPIAKLDDNFKEEKYSKLSNENRKFSYLRALSINVLIISCAKVFEQKYPEILSGEFDDDLLKNVDNEKILKGIKGIKDTVKKYIYKSTDVLTLEAAGYEVLGGLISDYIEASNICSDCNVVSNKKAKKFFDLIPEEYQHLENEEHYSRYLKIACYVAGMTDSYALNLFQKLRGIKT